AGPTHDREVSDELHPAGAGRDLGQCGRDQILGRYRLVQPREVLSLGRQEPAAGQQFTLVVATDQVQRDAARAAGVPDRGDPGAPGRGRRSAAARRSSWSSEPSVGSKTSSVTPIPANRSAISFAAAGVLTADSTIMSTQSPRKP